MAKLYLFSVVLALLVLVHAQDQSEFISIDCGIPENSNYTDVVTSLKYVSDAEFIDTGEIKDVLPEYRKDTLEKQFWNLRSFPVGDRNCYTIRPQGGKGKKYLIRARFMYGNYNNQQQSPTFDLYLGVDPWDAVVLSNASERVTKELIHVPPLDYMQICLINIGKGVPFISAIEIRPMDNDTYVTRSGSLKLHQRLDYGLERNRTVRYPIDIYDRIWSPIVLSSKNMSSSNHSIQQNSFNIPSIVLATAIMPKNDKQLLNFSWNTGKEMNKFYTYMHFAELQNLTKREHRAFNINVNSFSWFGPLTPSYLSSTTLYSIIGINGSNLEISIEKSESSSLPPLINAIEVFVAKQFPQLQTDQTEISALLNIKSTYNLNKNWQGDPCYPRVYSWDGLNCSYIGDRQPKITSLNLSSSGLAGGISSHISNLTMIEYLDLSNNNLNGTVPDFLATLPFLRALNLDNNNLSGIIPPALIERLRNGNLSLSAKGNPYLCQSEPCNKKEEAKKYVIPLAASLGGVTLALLTGGATFWSLKRRKNQVPYAEKQISGSSKQGKTILVPENKQFTYSQILSITNNFERVIGKGGFGTVYHGNLHIEVSVKMLSPAAVQGYKQFQEEAQLLTTVHHENLTSVLGYCDEDTHLGLVYEHMENGNLADHLSEKSNRILSWKERLRIALDAAQGLEYLHFGCKPPIIHRDLKSTNILLDKNFHAKLADFGLSKAYQSGDGAQAFVGTQGFLDPEFMTNRLNEKSDVYSFGVILLEILTGQPAITKSQDKPHVVKWVDSMLKEGKINNIIDPKLGIDIEKSSIWKFVELAMTCVSPSSTERPTMSQVVRGLKQCLAVLENSQENNGEHNSNLELVTDSQEK